MSYENYFVNNENLYKATVDYDENQENPRAEWDGFYSHMNIYLNNYNFGDNNGGEREDDLKEFVEKNYSDDDIIKMAFDGKFSTKYEYIINEDGEHVVKATRDNGFDYEIYDDENVIIDDIFDEFTFQELWYLCQNHPDFVALPIYAYIHSRITISARSFSDPWDSGWAGYIYVTRKDCEANGVEWSKKEMIKMLEAEVKLTDQWLTDQVYWIGIEKYDIEEGWEDYGNCGGFFSNNYGEKLTRELIKSLFDWDITDFYNEDHYEVQKFYQMTNDLEFVKETDRQNMLNKFSVTLANMFDKYKINADDLRIIKEAI